MEGNQKARLDSGGPQNRERKTFQAHHRRHRLEVALSQAEGSERGYRGAAQRYAQHDSGEHIAKEVHA